MKNTLKLTCCCAALLCVCAAGCEPVTTNRRSTTDVKFSPEIPGQARWVADGDSFEFVSDDGQSMTIRLEGIDCPERNQPYADQARDALMAMTKDRKLWIIVQGTDRYNRTLANVHDGSTFINGEMIRLGLAWHYAQYNDDTRLADLQTAAQRGQIGLWQDRNPEPPWDYRKRTK